MSTSVPVYPTQGTIARPTPVSVAVPSTAYAPASTVAAPTPVSVSVPGTSYTPAPAPVSVAVPGTSYAPSSTVGQNNILVGNQQLTNVTVGNQQLTNTPISSPNGPTLPITLQHVADGAAMFVPAGTVAAEGAATSLVGASKVAQALGGVGEPLFKLTWGIASDLASVVGSAVTFNIPGIFTNGVKIFQDGFINIGGIAKKLFEPFTMNSVAAGGAKASLGEAIGVGFQTAFKAIKSSFVWAIPAAAVNAFVDYKYHDVTDPKRLVSNFAADCIGYTATGLAGAAAGAAIGSMTCPLVGTIVGLGVGFVLGTLHEKYTRPLISDTIRDNLGT